MLHSYCSVWRSFQNTPPVYQESLKVVKASLAHPSILVQQATKFYFFILMLTMHRALCMNNLNITKHLSDFVLILINLGFERKNSSGFTLWITPRTCPTCSGFVNVDPYRFLASRTNFRHGPRPHEESSIKKFFTVLRQGQSDRLNVREPAVIKGSGFGIYSTSKRCL